MSVRANTGINKITNTGFQYDAVGNLTNDGFNSYAWTAEGLTASCNSGSVNYTYDSDDKRVMNSKGKLYWHGLQGEVLEETDLCGNLVADYVYFGSTRIAGVIPAVRCTTCCPTNWATRALSQIRMGPRWKNRIFIPLDKSGLNNYKYTGHERDTESGLDHTLYRQLSSAQGRWLSRNPNWSSSLSLPFPSRYPQFAPHRGRPKRNVTWRNAMQGNGESPNHSAYEFSRKRRGHGNVLQRVSSLLEDGSFQKDEMSDRRCSGRQFIIRNDI